MDDIEENQPNENYDITKYVEETRSISSLSDAPLLSQDYKLQRQLKNRHMTMISIGGVIGTGLFLGTATGLANGGPLGLLLAYLVVGSLCYSVMVSLGEMISYLPVAGGHIKLAERFVDPAFSFALGWNYWYNWTIGLPAELTAAAVLMQYWKDPDDVSPGVWITMCLVVVIIINVFGVGIFGECEFIFASIKVITIVGLMILGIVLDLGGGPNHDRIGFRYWHDPGPFVQFDNIPGAKGRFLGWWAVMTQAAFSFIGTEVVAIAGGEAKNPRKSIPKAIKRVYIRLLLFYVGGVFIIGLIVPSNHPDLLLKDSTAARSPFVIAIKTAGIRGLPSLINAAVLTSAWSASSSDLYSSSRALYSLAKSGTAPKIFSYVLRRNGLPIVAVAFNASFGLLAYMVLGTTSNRVFGWFVNMCAIAGLSNWFGIAITYLRYYKGVKAQGVDRKKMPFASRLNPYAAWWAAIACPTICLFSGFDVFLKGHWATDKFITTYFPFILFPFLYAGARIYLKVAPRHPLKMDFTTSGVEDIDAEEFLTSRDENKRRDDVFKKLGGETLEMCLVIDKDKHTL
ncbi:amino acid permease [Pyrrhoderma noxium]|uniref:Amino acid permease n=1 Tax=Pyrrhoderma noxium TaxID=2282107 RepID=A0A286UT92_9AGAM|nr:amino acid permease [Pyrrhoderma noxium]